MPLNVSFSRHNDTPILHVSGKLTESEFDTFTVALNALEREKNPSLVLDLSRLNFIDSQGLGRLVAFNAQLQKSDRNLIVLNTNPDPDAFVPSLFVMTNLHRILTIVNSLQAI